jgi:hypothetical protein
MVDHAFVLMMANTDLHLTKAIREGITLSDGGLLSKPSINEEPVHSAVLSVSPS